MDLLEEAQHQIEQYRVTLGDSGILTNDAYPVLSIEVARRAAAKYFDFGIAPSFVMGITQEQMPDNQVARLIVCIVKAFKDIKEISGKDGKANT